MAVGRTTDMADAYAMIGELKGKLDMIVDSMKDAGESRRRTHEKIEALGTEVHSMRADVRDLTDRVTAIEPTWKDYLNKQAQVQGAGKLGKFLWWLGGFVLAAAAWLAGHLGTFGK